VVGKTFSELYLEEVAAIAATVPAGTLEELATQLAAVRERGGRLFIIGVGGGAGHASHAVNDFRKLCGLEAYTPVDNVSELTARANDDGWAESYAGWLSASRLSPKDAILVFSVGGGSRERGVSANLVRALELAVEVGTPVYGIVGRDGGETARVADVCVVVQAPPERVTPHVEGFQAVLWHLLVSHPSLATSAGAWETLDAGR
jgi:D-sedoheptulose 7-phosphate isomerase